MNRPKRLSRPLCKDLICAAGWQYIDDLEDYCDRLEKALDEACDRIAYFEEFNEQMKELSMYNRRASKEEWKEYFLEDE